MRAALPLKRSIGILFILSGILLLAYPKLKVIYYERQLQKVMDSWLNSLAQLEEGGQSLDGLADLSAEYSNLDSQQASLDLKKRTENEARQAKLKAEYLAKNTEGLLKIDKIDLYMPILKGVTEKNLNISVASIEETGVMGQVGNYCIAGHRSRTYGRQFNRLDELATGDIIEVISESQTYVYGVSGVFLVEAEDTWVLEGNMSEPLISLITCDYSQEPSLRLVIRGTLLEEQSREAETEQDGA